MTMIELTPLQHLALQSSLNTLDQYPGFLIADDTGFGKTHEALAVARRLNQPITVFAPKHLLTKWHREAKRWNLTITAKSHAYLSRNRRGVPLPPNSTIIADEAHHFINPTTNRYQSLAITALGNTLLLLSATPLQNQPRDLLHLLALVSPECHFAAHQPLNPRYLAYAANHLSISRKRPSTRPLHTLTHTRSIHTTTIHQLTQQLCLPHEPYQLFYALLLKRNLSSNAALKESAKRLIRYLHELDEAQSQNRTLPRTTFDTDFPHGQRAFTFLLPPAPTPSPHHDLKARAKTAEHLLDQLDTTEPSAAILHNATKPVTAFTCYKATANTLFHQLQHHHHTILWTGDQITSNLLGPLQHHQLPTTNHILICTDVANCGVDLDHTKTLVHLDLPWNPNTTKQREGRITRGLSQSPATIITIQPDAYTEQELRILHINRSKQHLNQTYLNPQIPELKPTPPPHDFVYRLNSLKGLQQRDLPATNWRASFNLDVLRRYALSLPAGLRAITTQWKRTTERHWNDGYLEAIDDAARRAGIISKTSDFPEFSIFGDFEKRT